MVKTDMDVVTEKGAIAVFRESALRNRAKELHQALSARELEGMIDLVERVTPTDAVLSYVHRLSAGIKAQPSVEHGVSMRGALAMVRIAKVRALVEGRPAMTPEDVRALAAPVFGHRIILRKDAVIDDEATPAKVIAQALQSVEVPTTSGYA